MRCPLYTCPKPELPPRARRILVRKTQKGHHHGTTSACAENTTLLARRTNRARNYLRVRGEYARPRTSWPTPWELPPRARRILNRRSGSTYPRRTTSACAENTLTRDDHDCYSWNYLRVRGEYAGGWQKHFECLELPPRARRILSPLAVRDFLEGTTSACAENTGFIHRP